jgi:hypothetical protein
MSNRAPSMSRPQPRRKAVAATRALSPACLSPVDQFWEWQLWGWCGAFAFGIAVWTAVALLIKAIV